MTAMDEEMFFLQRVVTRAQMGPRAPCPLADAAASIRQLLVSPVGCDAEMGGMSFSCCSSPMRLQNGCSRAFRLQ